MPRKTWRTPRAKGAFNAEAIATAAVQNVGMVTPTVLSFPATLISADERSQKEFCTKLGEDYAAAVFDQMTRPQPTPGYEHLKPVLDRFTDDHPEFTANVFVMMRFRTDQHFVDIYKAVKESLAAYGLIAHRADDKIYPKDDDLWDNVCVYMMGCHYGLCIFEDIDEREFNPNVPLEYGFMRAIGRRVLFVERKTHACDAH